MAGSKVGAASLDDINPSAVNELARPLGRRKRVLASPLYTQYITDEVISHVVLLSGAYYFCGHRIEYPLELGS
jgi:hypothetical protein